MSRMEDERIKRAAEMAMTPQLIQQPPPPPQPAQQQGATIQVRDVPEMVRAGILTPEQGYGLLFLGQPPTEFKGQ